MRFSIAFAAVLLTACNTFSKLDPPADSGRDVRTDISATDATTDGRSDLARDASVDLNRADMPPLAPLDDSIEDDWFVTALPIAVSGAVSLSLIETPTELVFGFISPPDTEATIVKVTKPRPSAQEYGNVFAPNRSSIPPAPQLMDDGSVLVTPIPQSFTLFGNQGGITGFTRVSDGGPIASIALDISDVNTSSFVLSTTQATGFQTAVLGGGNSKNSVGSSPVQLVAASDDGLFVDGVRFDRTLRDIEQVDPLGGRFVTSDGPLAAFVSPPNFLLFDPFDPNRFVELSDNNTLNFAIGYIGYHEPSAESEFLLAQREQDNGFTISVRRVDWNSQLNRIPLVDDLPVISLPGVTPRLIDVKTYFDPSDANDEANPANAIVTTVESDGGNDYIAFRVILIEDQNLELIACRRFQIGVTKTEMDSVVYRDENGDIVAAVATLYHPVGNDTERQFGVDGVRFPNLNVPDAELQNPYDASCQTCDPFAGCITAP